MNKAIGGYLELELGMGSGHVHKNLIHLNSGRNALEYILKTRGITKAYIPAFSCKVLMQPLKNLNIDYQYYSVNSKLEPASLPAEIHANEVVLYTNYFGVKDDYIRELEHTDLPFVLDYSQSLFIKPSHKFDCFYSPRKFVGVADGGYAALVNFDLKDMGELKTSHSTHRMLHLLRRIDISPEAGYQEFITANSSLNNESLAAMSALTQRLLMSFDYGHIKNKRLSNFIRLHSLLGHVNGLDLNFQNIESPLCYPFLCNNAQTIREIAARERIYIPRYWPDTLGPEYLNADEVNCIENILHLPIDQRYGVEDMDRISDLMISHLEK